MIPQINTHTDNIIKFPTHTIHTAEKSELPTLSIWSDLTLTNPSIPRKRLHPTTEFGRPGLPSLTQLIAHHPHAKDLATAILRYSHAPQYKGKAAALFTDLINSTPPGTTWEDRVVLWAARRLQTASAVVVCNYISMVSTIITSEYGIDLTTSHLIRAFTKAIRRLSGDHRSKTTTPITSEQITDLIHSLPTPHNAIILIAWKRAGRVRDVLETREGGLWLVPEVIPTQGEKKRVVMLEEPFDKVSWAGLKDHTPILIEDTLLPLLTPYLSQKAPETPPRMRPLLWPHITTEKITRMIQKLHPDLSSRSIRRGALQTLIQKGFTLENCQLLSHHHTLDGLMKYLETTDSHTFQTLLKMQASL